MPLWLSIICYQKLRTHRHIHYTHERNVGTDCTYIIKGGFLNIILGHSCAATAVRAACNSPHHISFSAHPYTEHQTTRPIPSSALYFGHDILLYTRAHSACCWLRDMLRKNNCITEFSYYTFVTFILEPPHSLTPFIKSLFCVRKHLVWYTFPTFVCLVLLYIICIMYCGYIVYVSNSNRPYR